MEIYYKQSNTTLRLNSNVMRRSAENCSDAEPTSPQWYITGFWLTQSYTLRNTSDRTFYWCLVSGLWVLESHCLIQWQESVTPSVPNRCPNWLTVWHRKERLCSSASWSPMGNFCVLYYAGVTDHHQELWAIAFGEDYLVEGTMRIGWCFFPSKREANRLISLACT